MEIITKEKQSKKERQMSLSTLHLGRVNREGLTESMSKGLDVAAC